MTVVFHKGLNGLASDWIGRSGDGWAELGAPKLVGSGNGKEKAKGERTMSGSRPFRPASLVSF
jgi:hypothetical protein